MAPFRSKDSPDYKFSDFLPNWFSTDDEDQDGEQATAQMERLRSKAIAFMEAAAKPQEPIGKVQLRRKEG